jgi:hypothetical protein
VFVARETLWNFLRTLKTEFAWNCLLLETLWDFLRSLKTELWKLFIARNSLELPAIFDNRTLETVCCSKFFETSCQLWKHNSLEIVCCSKSLRFLAIFENRNLETVYCAKLFETSCDLWQQNSRNHLLLETLWDFLRSLITELSKLLIARNSLRFLASFENRTLWKQNWTLEIAYCSETLWNFLRALKTNKQISSFLWNLLGCVYRGQSSSSVYKACRLPDQGSWALIGVKFAAVK